MKGSCEWSLLKNYKKLRLLKLLPVIDFRVVQTSPPAKLVHPNPLEMVLISMNFRIATDRHP